MKTKSFLLLLACIIVTSIFVCLYGDPKPTIHDLVSETHRQLSHLKNIKVVAEQKEPQEIERYLKYLGFIDTAGQYPEQGWTNVTLPVVVTGATEGQAPLAVGFLRSCQQHFTDHHVIVYDLGLDTFESTMLNKICNSSNCTFRKFDFDFYPSHVGNLKIFAYRPIIIQEVLNQAGAVLWMDVHYQFASTPDPAVLQRAEQEGLSAWSIDHPTSTLTHQGMFEYFHTTPVSYYFHHMVQPDCVVVYNTKKIHTELMLPWVRCALVSDCIAPIGSQSSGCRFDKKPLYRYSGCHRYDMSALNVILGMVYENGKQPYVVNDTLKFFKKVEESRESSPSVLMQLVDNATSHLTEQNV